MSVKDTAEIRRIALFREMEEANFRALMRASYFQLFPSRVSIVEEGDPAPFLPILIEGAVELRACWEGRQAAISLVEPVATILPAATMTAGHYLMTGTTLAKSRIALVPSEDVRRISAEDRAFGTALAAELARDFRSVICQLKELKLRGSLERIANFLLRRSEIEGGAAEFDLPVEKRLLASLLGMTPENLSRAFANLRAHGVVVKGAHVRLAAPDKLRRFARPCPSLDGEHPPHG